MTVFDRKVDFTGFFNTTGCTGTSTPYGPGIRLHGSSAILLDVGARGLVDAVPASATSSADCA
jgi:hypothetical protein